MTMSKSTETYWNPLLSGNKLHCKPIDGMEGVAGLLTLAIDEESGDYTRLTRFGPGADTSSFGPKSLHYTV
jgi:hypothetical protein